MHPSICRCCLLTSVCNTLNTLHHTWYVAVVYWLAHCNTLQHTWNAAVVPWRVCCNTLHHTWHVAVVDMCTDVWCWALLIGCRALWSGYQALLTTWHCTTYDLQLLSTCALRENVPLDVRVLSLTSTLQHTATHMICSCCLLTHALRLQHTATHMRGTRCLMTSALQHTATYMIRRSCLLTSY